MFFFEEEGRVNDTIEMGGGAHKIIYTRIK